MRAVYTVQQIRDAEAQFFAENPHTDLMVVAAGHVARVALTFEAKRILVVVGPGNNGGDGLFAAMRLAVAGRQVTLWNVDDRVHPKGLAAATVSGCREVNGVRAVRDLPETDLVIDAYLGIGARPGLPEAVATLANECRALGVPVLSIDLPSGLAGDETGAGESFWASRTITFGGLKTCHVARPAAERCGRVEVADLGLPLPTVGLAAAETHDVARRWPYPEVTANKYSRGVVGLDVGSDAYPGAAVLSALGAAYSGAGMVRYLGGVDPLLLLASAPNVVMGPGRVEALVAGSGWGSGSSIDRVQSLLDQGVPCVLDADALTALPATLRPDVLLTPHAGELARLLGIERSEVEANPLATARTAAARWNASVLIKGATQYCVRPDGQAVIAVAGPAWTATAGSGDVLAGIAGTLLASGLDAHTASWVAASVQAMTAEANKGPRPPQALARRLPGVIASL